MLIVANAKKADHQFGTAQGDGGFGAVERAGERASDRARRLR